MLEIPQEYIISKFYELGYQVKYLKYNNTYNCKCPICREGKSFNKKRRCFYIPDRNLIFCHNCGWSSQPYNWIKHVSGVDDATLLKEIRDCDYDVGITLEEPKIERVIEVPTLPDDSINLFDPIQLRYYRANLVVQEALKLITSRKLDTAVNRPRTMYVSLKDKIHRNRLVIPFFDQHGDILFYQSRKIFNFDTKERYISKLNGERTIFNLDKVSLDIDDVYIFEGPFDACFTKNGIAIGGITEGRQLFTEKQQEQLDTTLALFGRVWVLDSQWLDDTSLKKTKMLLEDGQSVFIWPENTGKRFKDFNELCIALDMDEVQAEYIQRNTFKGLEGVLKLEQLRKTR